MIILENKEAVIEIFKEVGRPLNQEMVQDLIDNEQYLIENSLPLSVAIIEIKCRICGYECVSIVPAIADLDNLECNNCQNMTMQEKEEKEWWE